MELIQKPDSLSLLGNMKNFVVKSTEEIVFALKYKNNTLFEASYTASNRLEIDVTEIIEQNLSFDLILNNDFYEQKNICKTFTALINSVEIPFTVLRAGVAYLHETTNNFLSANFLTWQPAEKEVSFHSPEWITFFATQDCRLILESCVQFLEQGTCSVVILGTAAAGKVYTANVIASQVVRLLGRTPQYFDIFISDNRGAQISNRQRFYLTDNRSENEEYFLFENSLGGIDSFRAYGENTLMPEYEFKNAINNKKLTSVGVGIEREYERNTGMLSTYESIWLHDFFPAKNKYKFHQNGIIPIAVTECNVQKSDSDFTCDYTFKYKLSSVTKYLNYNKYG